MVGTKFFIIVIFVSFLCFGIIVIEGTNKIQERETFCNNETLVVKNSRTFCNEKEFICNNNGNCFYIKQGGE